LRLKSEKKLNVTDLSKKSLRDSERPSIRKNEDFKRLKSKKR